MKKIILLFLVFSCISTFAQEEAWVYFNDKPDAAFYLANPLQMLSQRALDRRTAQGISLDNKDVPLSQNYTDQVAAAPAISKMAKSKWLNALHVRGTVTSIRNLQNLSFVSHIEFADKSLNVSRRPTENLKTAGSNKNLDTQINYAYGTSANQIQMLNGHLLHQQDFTGNGKIIAVLDAGFPGVDVVMPFQRLRNAGKILGGYDFVNRSPNFYTGGTHGTLVLSTMGGYVENQLVGTAPDASYYLFITEDIDDENPVEESYWVEAAETADSLGVDIINTSLGYFTYQDPRYSRTYSDMNGTTAFISRGAAIAFSRGMICVVSAGNSGNSSNPYISAPADAVDILAVGAVDAMRNYATFSSIGPSFDGRVKPDVMAQGVSSIVSDPTGNVGGANGTSFAGPITSGMVASVWQALPTKTNAEIIQLIKQSAHLFATPNPQYGYGIPNYSAALNAGLGTAGFSSDAFILYPNPANRIVNLQFKGGSKKAQIVIYTNLGQEVISANLTENATNFSVEKLPSGIYYYKIFSENASQSGKFLKN